MTTQLNLSAYRSPKKQELYLFIEQGKALESLPPELLVMFGTPEHIFNFEITPQRKLARENAEEVIASIKNKGYFLQMPPNEVEKLGDMPAPPEHLDNIF